MKITQAVASKLDALSDTFDQEAPPTGALYIESYLLIRTAVGVIGIALPIACFLGEPNIAGGLHFRGSISAYYHSRPMRDVFVGALCVIGVLLMTYMSGKIRSLDFWFSLVAGVTILGVAFFPTWRPGLEDKAPRCGVDPMPEGCAAIQQQLGEGFVATIHFSCAVVFILSLAAISFIFARREEKYAKRPGRARFQRLCGWVILLAIAWVAIGGIMNWNIWQLTPLYVGEVVSVWAFGASWLSKGKDIRKLLGLKRKAPPPDEDVVPYAPVEINLSTESASDAEAREAKNRDSRR